MSGTRAEVAPDLAAPGSSDPGRHPEILPPIETPLSDEQCRFILDAAGTLVWMPAANKRRRRVPLIEALMWQLATGQTSRRRSPTAFIRLARDCAQQLDGKLKEEKEPQDLSGWGDTAEEMLARLMARRLVNEPPNSSDSG
ncbi:hypothetical protein [Sphingomonas adhaesiva]|uniref:hypothetical protein n=1 Tax=Sphingomonas adhaesiva TaxID=28212 RepID=UPI002FF83F12